MWSIDGIGREFIVSMDIIKDIYMGKITKWNDSRLTAVNPGRVMKKERMGTVDSHMSYSACYC